MDEISPWRDQAREHIERIKEWKIAPLHTVYYLRRLMEGLQQSPDSIDVLEDGSIVVETRIELIEPVGFPVLIIRHVVNHGGVTTCLVIGQTTVWTLEPRR